MLPRLDAFTGPCGLDAGIKQGRVGLRVGLRQGQQEHEDPQECLPRSHAGPFRARHMKLVHGVVK